jgi:hypothetical protein
MCLQIWMIICGGDIDGGGYRFRRGFVSEQN